MNSAHVSQLKWALNNAIQSYLLDGVNGLLHGQVHFAQVGANDGQMADPISRYVKDGQWRGLLFEPVPSYFARLTEFYRGVERVALVNGACGAGAETLTFYEIGDDSGVPEPWMKGLSSFDAAVVRKHFPSAEDFHRYVAVRPVPVRPLNDFLSEYGQTKCEVLLIDTEGFELSVLRGFDIDKYAPALIIIEHQHLDLNAYNDCVHDMRLKGYLPAVGYFDTFFFDPQFFGDETASLLAPFAGRTYANW